MTTDALFIDNIPIDKEKTFKKLFESFYPSLCVFANKYTQDTDISADIVQDAFVYLWEIKKDISTIHSAKSYLFKTVKNKCLNYLRDQKTRDKIQNEHLEDETFFRDNLIETETYQIIQEALNVLSPQSRKIIELSLDGLKNNEIAELLNISINTVKTVRSRAFKVLRGKLNRDIFLFLITHCL